MRKLWIWISILASIPVVLAQQQIVLEEDKIPLFLVIPAVVIAIMLLILFIATFKQNITRFWLRVMSLNRLFSRVKLPRKELEHLKEEQGLSHEHLESYVQQLKDLEKKADQTEDSFKDFTFIAKDFFSKLVGGSHAHTDEELNQLLKAKRKSVVEFSQNLSEMKYSGYQPSKQELVSLINDFKRIISSQALRHREEVSDVSKNLIAKIVQEDMKVFDSIRQYVEVLKREDKKKQIQEMLASEQRSLKSNIGKAKGVYDEILALYCQLSPEERKKVYPQLVKFYDNVNKMIFSSLYSQKSKEELAYFSRNLEKLRDMPRGKTPLLQRLVNIPSKLPEFKPEHRVEPKAVPRAEFKGRPDVFEIKLRIPRFRLPKFKAPSIKVPEISVPRFSLPKVTIKEKISGFVSSIRLPDVKGLFRKEPKFGLERAEPLVKEKKSEELELPELKFLDLPKAKAGVKGEQFLEKVPRPSRFLFLKKIFARKVKPEVPRFGVIKPKASWFSKLRMPKLHVSKFKVPEVHVPKVHLPKPHIKPPRFLFLKKIFAKKVRPVEVKPVGRLPKVPEFEVVPVKKPFVLPKLHAPRFSLPKIRLPKLHVPKVHLPRIHLPRWINKKRTTQVKPKLVKPQIEVKKVSRPSRFLFIKRLFARRVRPVGRLPKVPKFEVVPVKKPFVLPKLHVPKFSLPKLHVPRLHVPKIHLSKFVGKKEKVASVSKPKLVRPKISVVSKPSRFLFIKRLFVRKVKPVEMKPKLKLEAPVIKIRPKITKKPRPSVFSILKSRFSREERLKQKVKSALMISRMHEAPKPELKPSFDIKKTKIEKVMPVKFKPSKMSEGELRDLERIKEVVKSKPKAPPEVSPMAREEQEVMKRINSLVASMSNVEVMDNLGVIRRMVSRADAQLASGNVSDAEETYESIKPIFVGLPEEQKKEVYPELLAFYKKLKDAAANSVKASVKIKASSKQVSDEQKIIEMLEKLKGSIS